MWLIIAIKLFVFFVVIKFIFFPNFLNTVASNDQEKADYVRHELIDKGHQP